MFSNEHSDNGNVVGHIQHLRTLMYKVSAMTQDEAFLLFMQGLDPKIQEQI